MGLSVMANGDVRGGAPPGLSADGNGYPDAEWARLEPP